MIFISLKNERNEEETSDSKQYLLRVVYDSHDKNVHKLLEGIFGPEQMLDVKNGKIAKINSTITPKERDKFLNMISEALNKMEEEEKEENEPEVDSCKEESNEEYDDYQEKSVKEEINQKDLEEDNSKKVSAEKLIQEFANFLNSIS